MSVAWWIIVVRVVYLLKEVCYGITFGCYFDQTWCYIHQLILFEDIFRNYFYASCGNGVMKRHTMCGKIRKRAKDISLPPTSASKFMHKKINFDVIIRFLISSWVWIQRNQYNIFRHDFIIRWINDDFYNDFDLNFDDYYNHLDNYINVKHIKDKLVGYWV